MHYPVPFIQARLTGPGTKTRHSQTVVTLDLQHHGSQLQALQRLVVIDPNRRPRRYVYRSSVRVCLQEVRCEQLRR